MRGFAIDFTNADPLANIIRPFSVGLVVAGLSMAVFIF
jgi:hypothetical protein